ncbi:MAG: diguanylate cyclase [Leptospiraceae bacterium]|nr:diguanylate cyclase [Leptospiraceae bacterium]
MKLKSSLQNIKILLCEDDSDTLNLLKKYLEESGANLETANNGAVGFEKFNKFDPDLLITDLSMPDVDGLTLIEKINKIKSIPCIILSAYGDENALLKAIEIGVTKFIRKPVKKDDFLKSVSVITDALILRKIFEKREQMMLSVIENMPFQVIVLENKNIVYVNPALLEYLGLKNLSQVTKTGFSMDEYIFDRGDPRLFAKKFTDWSYELAESEESEILIGLGEKNQKDNDYKIFAVNIRPTQDKNIIIVIFNDITRFEDEINKHKRVALLDPLTQALNRNSLNESFDVMINNAKNSSKSFSIIIFDIDFFKKVNDTFGHQIGDEVLKTIVAIVAKIIRQSDKLFRIGGEEFLLLLPDTAGKGAMMLAEKLRLAIANHDFNEIKNLTCSFGVYEALFNENPESIMAKADSALYQAKKSGRNQTKSAN